MAITPLLESDLPFPLLHRGKVRDMYQLSDKAYLMVATDRISAFDVIMQQGVAGKGALLTRLSQFWFQRFERLVSNHLLMDNDAQDSTQCDLLDALSTADKAQIAGRHQVVKACSPIKVEAVVRGFLFGSGWLDYQSSGEVCGIALPKGMHFAQQLEQPIFTPSSKADVGKHDENIAFEQMVDLLGHDLAERIKRLSLVIYTEAFEFARTKGIMIADTKMEFGLDQQGDLLLIDELLTPDSSRFWSADNYETSYLAQQSPSSFDKQIVRDYLDGLEWNKEAPPPYIDAAILERTTAKYQEVGRLLMG